MNKDNEDDEDDRELMNRKDLTLGEKRVLSFLKKKGAYLFDNISEEEYDILLEFGRGQQLKMRTAMRLFDIAG